MQTQTNRQIDILTDIDTDLRTRYSFNVNHIWENKTNSLIATLVLATCSLSIGSAFSADLPQLVPQPSPQQVVDEHLDALNKCNWDRLMAQYPPEVLIVFADGASFRGREAVGDLFAGSLKRKQTVV